MVVMRERSILIKGQAALEAATSLDRLMVRIACSGLWVKDMRPPIVQILARRRGGMCRYAKWESIVLGVANWNVFVFFAPTQRRGHRCCCCGCYCKRRRHSECHNSENIAVVELGKAAR
jgi:hypothetical protein